jgi:hypothetical protein
VRLRQAAAAAGLDDGSREEALAGA